MTVIEHLVPAGQATPPSRRFRSWQGAESLKVASMALVLSAVACAAMAQSVVRTPLPPSHPLVGTWRIDLPNGCYEEYDIRSDGTKLSRSGEERNESDFEISLSPGEKGFYKWTDKITKANGRPDCGGSITALGHVAVNYIRLHPNGQRYLLCQAEDLSSCYAEFRRTSSSV